MKKTKQMEIRNIYKEKAPTFTNKGSFMVKKGIFVVVCLFLALFIVQNVSASRSCDGAPLNCGCDGVLYNASSGTGLVGWDVNVKFVYADNTSELVNQTCNLNYTCEFNYSSVPSQPPEFTQGYWKYYDTTSNTSLCAVPPTTASGIDGCEDILCVAYTDDKRYYGTNQSLANVSGGGTDGNFNIYASSVLNFAPEFTFVNDGSSDASTPTTEGTSVTFTARATDLDGDDWKLLICDSDNLTGTNCADTQICNSSFVANDTITSCSKNTAGQTSETYNWFAFACDSINCSQSNSTDSPYNVNHYPTISAPSITGHYYTNDLIACTSGTPADDDTSDNPLVNTTIWKINGGIVSGENGLTFDCGAVVGCDSGDTITCEQNANDTHGLVSAFNESNGIVIQNNPPTIDDISPTNLTPTINETDSITFDHNSSDIDVTDTLTYQWLKNGIIQSSSSSYNFITNYTSAGVHNITLIVSDGTNSTSQTWILTVLDVNRVPVFTVPTDDFSTSVSPTFEGSSVTFNGTATDDDGEQYRLLVCDSDTTTGTSCSATQICVSLPTNSGSPASCLHQTTGELAETYEWWSFACDSSNCSALSNSTSPYNVNHAPVSSAPTILGTNNTNGLLYCLNNSITDSDVGDSANIHTYVWRSNTNIITGQNNNVLDCSNVSINCDKTDSITCALDAIDNHGFVGATSAQSNAVIISNSVPTAPTIDLTPDLPTSIDNLVCTVTIPSEDNDSDLINYTYNWYKEGSLQPAETTVTTANSDTVLSSLTSSGEHWNCTVNPNDGDVNGPSTSDSVTISNTVPTISMGHTPSSPITIQDIDCWGLTSDADGNSVSANYNLTGAVTGSGPATCVVVNATTGEYNCSTTISAASTSDNDVITCTMTPYDSEPGIPNSTIITVGFVPAPTTLIATLNEGDETSVDLNWTAVPDADFYYVTYGDNVTEMLNVNPYAAAEQITVPNTSTTWTDSTAGVVQKRYYRVSAGKGSARSFAPETVGKFDISVFKGPLNKGLNIISLPLEPWNLSVNNIIRPPEDLNHSSRNRISRYGATFQRTDFYGTAWNWWGDFSDLELDRGYYMFPTIADYTIHVVGKVQTATRTVNIQQGLNFFGYASTLTKKLNDTITPPGIGTPAFGNEYRIARYNGTWQRTDYYGNGSKWWGDFNTLDPGMGYYMYPTPDAYTITYNPY